MQSGGKWGACHPRGAPAVGSTARRGGAATSPGLALQCPSLGSWTHAPWVTQVVILPCHRCGSVSPAVRGAHPAFSSPPKLQPGSGHQPSFWAGFLWWLSRPSASLLPSKDQGRPRARSVTVGVLASAKVMPGGCGTRDSPGRWMGGIAFPQLAISPHSGKA